MRSFVLTGAPFCSASSTTSCPEHRSLGFTAKSVSFTSRFAKVVKRSFRRRSRFLLRQARTAKAGNCLLMRPPSRFVELHLCRLLRLRKKRTPREFTCSRLTMATKLRTPSLRRVFLQVANSPLCEKLNLIVNGFLPVKRPESSIFIRTSRICGTPGIWIPSTAIHYVLSPIVRCPMSSSNTIG